LREETERVAAVRAPAGYAVEAFRPVWWLRGAHAQTLGGKFMRRDPGIALRRERWETPDGDFLDLDFPEGGAAPAAGAPVVVVLHGLEGSAGRRYMLWTYRELLGRGLVPVGLNFRSCSGEPNRTVRFYHSGETTDLAWVVERLAARWPGVRLGAVGYSLGGNVLLRYLGERGAGAGVAAAVAVSVPFDLSAGAARLDRGFMSRVYTTYFMRSLRRKARLKEALLRGACDYEAVVRARTLREFDDAATAPLHGFADAEDYYRRCSSATVLERIRVPTLVLQAEDDPFLPREALPVRALAENPWIVAGVVARGGHVGFIERRRPGTGRFWAEREAARFLATVLFGGGSDQVGQELEPAL